MKLKYIVTNEESFAIFDLMQDHNKVAISLDGKPVSAGFCTIMAKDGGDSPLANIHCFG